MNMPKLFERRSAFATPLLVKIGVVAGIWFFASGLTKLLPAPSWDSLVPVISIAMQICALIAVWKLRKWGVYASIVFAILGFLTMFAIANKPVSPTVVIVLLIIRLFPLIPALIYWKRFADHPAASVQAEPSTAD
jgi:hypothetical protein